MLSPLSGPSNPADLEPLKAALRAALDTADQVEQVGLRRALRIVEDFVPPAAPTPVDWARAVLAHAGIDPRTAEVKAVRELRRAHAGLSLRDAVALVRLVVTHSG
ncbi:hypothetical protein [Streptomyces sp. CBMA123]|uniref:hypothetical protein n=1 Tax=Streptomyces sp. CBMA123 TaxID=1896313 RepID=UPI001661FB14|nr:hypothetical protein [Streptomyces sp. CBMA123]MBD0692992.1 hypothetical protein [Streptomyces sp. CBMA123]